MKESRCTDEQIDYALRQPEGGAPVADVCRQMGMIEARRCLVIGDPVGAGRYLDLERRRFLLQAALKWR